MSDFSRWLLEERHLTISGGLANLAGKSFRVWHLGKAASDEYVADFLSAVEAFLRTRG